MVRRAGRGFVYCVADGVGGTGAGRYASWQVVDSLAFFFNVPAARFDPGRTMQEIIRRAHVNLLKLAAEKREYTQAAATLAMIYVAPTLKRGYMLSLGDSGVYLLHQDRLHLLNEDHRDERGKVTSAIGLNRALQVSSRPLRFADGQVYLLCTDGVREELPDALLRRKLSDVAHPLVVARDIVLSAEQAGGRDNSTAVVVRFGACPELPARGEDDEEWD